MNNSHKMLTKKCADDDDFDIGSSSSSEGFVNDKNVFADKGQTPVLMQSVQEDTVCVDMSPRSSESNEMKELSMLECDVLKSLDFETQTKVKDEGLLRSQRSWLKGWGVQFNQKPSDKIPAEQETIFPSFNTNAIIDAPTSAHLCFSGNLEPDSEP